MMMEIAYIYIYVSCIYIYIVKYVYIWPAVNIVEYVKPIFTIIGHVADNVNSVLNRTECSSASDTPK